MRGVDLTQFNYIYTCTFKGILHKYDTHHFLWLPGCRTKKSRKKEFSKRVSQKPKLQIYNTVLYVIQYTTHRRMRRGAGGGAAALPNSGKTVGKIRAKQEEKIGQRKLKD